MSKKLYSVQVSIEFDMPVVADSKEDAEYVAEEYWEEELRNRCLLDPIITARPLTDPAKLPEEFEGSIPYGLDEDDIEITCEDLLAQNSPLAG